MNEFERWNDILEIIKSALHVSDKDIKDITVLKKGMTNHSFLFTCNKQTYIMRIPGEGTSKLIHRNRECDVYSVIENYSICDEIIYIDPENGYKISKYWKDARICNPNDFDDVKRCMEKLRCFHNRELKVEFTFDIFEQIDFYESLWINEKSCYKDYEETKAGIFALKEYIDLQDKHWVLTHIDAVSDNFLFVPNEKGEEIRLVDWEYAGMQDACVDIAMFAIYAMYNEEQIEQLINLYYLEGCDIKTRLKIYCYIAAGGLLWSNWCEYKRQLGIEFGKYSLQQYRYAKRYYEIFMEKMQNE